MYAWYPTWLLCTPQGVVIYSSSSRQSITCRSTTVIKQKQQIRPPPPSQPCVCISHRDVIWFECTQHYRYGTTLSSRSLTKATISCNCSGRRTEACSQATSCVRWPSPWRRPRWKSDTKPAPPRPRQYRSPTTTTGHVRNMSLLHNQ